MTPAEAAWVRANVWTGTMRKSYRDTPDATTSCPCQYGMTGHCQTGACDRCPRGVPLPGPIGYVCGRSGDHPLHLAEPYTHPAASATGRRETPLAMIWYADRLCRWLCPCGCHSRTRGEQGLLFEAVSA